MGERLAVVAHNNSLSRAGLKAIVGSSCPSFTVETAENSSILARFVKHDHADILIVDVDLAGMEGLTGLAAMLRHNPEPRVCLTMPVVTREIVASCISHGILSCVQRATIADEVCEAIQALADGRMYFSRLAEVGVSKSATDIPILTEQQLNVLRSMATGRSNKQIARQLGICEGTVKAHLNAAYRAMGVSNRVSAATKLRELSRASNNMQRPCERDLVAGNDQITRMVARH